MTQYLEIYYSLLKYVEQKLYPNYKIFTELSCIIRMFQVKVINALSDRTLTISYFIQRDV